MCFLAKAFTFLTNYAHKCGGTEDFMKQQLKLLPDAELEIMLLLWQAKEPMPRNFFDEHFKNSKNWADSTILSLLSRLAKKGFIHVEKCGNRNLYYPIVKQSEYLSLENNSFLNKFHKNSLMGFVASMADANSLNQKDISELEEYLQKLKQGE